MSKNTWFKHYNNASQGHTLSVLWANGDTEAISLFWLLLELISRFESDESRGEMTISWFVLQRETNWKPSKCRRVLSRISPVSKIEINEEQEGYVSFRVPNWLELQENRGGKNQAKKEQNTDRGEKREVRRKNIEVEEEKKEQIPQHQHQNFSNEFFEKEKKAGEVHSPAQRKEQHSFSVKDSEKKLQTFEIIEELQGNSTLDPVLKFISPAVQKNWVNRYEKTWLIDVLVNAVSYHASKENAVNVSKINDWGLRLQRWLAREKKPCLIGLNDITEATINRWSAELDEEQKNRGFEHGL